MVLCAKVWHLTCSGGCGQEILSGQMSFQGSCDKPCKDFLKKHCRLEKQELLQRGYMNPELDISLNK